ncbi:ArnT family glycosyltransferase [Granulicella sibirica]|uniref:Polymyxin resistance protein ArnT n=1 Tax=Granulicella sibirica TaxID=2479048 RepID=A0A4Q0T8W8_9BACT|nr:glycosyltransferase family 39 protein [Granulicella sibirica]RXH58479.1 Polymyxin resistance protein ArnT [Granulicella sibirica]
MATTQTARNRLILIALWVAFYASFTLFLPPLLDDADSVHAEVAREMLLRHDWVTLYANGIRYLEKAPILYWSMALSFRLFGVSTASARFPISLTVLALALFLERFARLAFQSTRAGLYAGLMLLSSFGIFIFTRITIPDADVCLWLTLALLAFWTNEQPATEPGAPVKMGAPPSAASSPKVGWTTKNAFVSRTACYLFATVCALNVLTKGLIGIVFPIGIVAVYLLITRGIRGATRRINQLHPWTSILVFLAIAAPWHILIGLANPTQGHPAPIAYSGGHWQVPLPTNGNVHGWFWFYFMNEHLLRYLNLRVPRDYDTVPLALFWGLLFIWLMPWSAYLYQALKSAGGKLWKEPGGSPPALAEIARSTNLLLLLWAAIPLLFFSLSTRQEYYVLPAIPALILLLAGWLAEDSESKTSKAPTRIALVMFILGTAASAAIVFFLFHTAKPSPDTDLATLLKQNPGDYALSFGHFLDLNAQAMGMFRLPLALTALCLFFGGFASWHFRRNSKPHAANVSLAAATFVFLLAAHSGLQIFSPVLSSQKLAQVLVPQLQAEDLIILHGEYESGSTLGFYLHRNDLHILEGRSSNLWYGSFFPDAPKIFETRESVTRRWSGPQRVFLWQDPSDPDRPVLTLPGSTYLIVRSGGKEILSNQPNR